jgi:hypothetical protein
MAPYSGDSNYSATNSSATAEVLTVGPATLGVQTYLNGVFPNLATGLMVSAGIFTINGQVITPTSKIYVITPTFSSLYISILPLFVVFRPSIRSNP